MALAEREYNAINKENQQNRAQKEKTESDLLILQQRAEQAEIVALKKVEVAIKASATELHSKSGNSEEVTQQIWRRRIEQNRASLQERHSKSHLPHLSKLYEKAKQEYDRLKDYQEQQRLFLDRTEQERGQLKTEIEGRVDELDKLERQDRIQFEAKKKEFLKKLEALQAKQVRLLEFQKKWEEGVSRLSQQGERRYAASEALAKAKQEEERVLTRTQKHYQIAKELLQRLWLKSATGNYREWSLPSSTTSQFEKASLPQIKALEAEQITPPLRLQEDKERAGRRLHFRAEQGESSSSTKATILKQPWKALKISSSSSEETSTSVLDQVQAWIKQSSSQDQERWEIKEKLDLLEKEISKQRREQGKGGGNLQSMLDEDKEGNDTKSDFSRITQGSRSSNTLSGISQAKGSLISFGGKSFVGTKKASSQPLPSINEKKIKAQPTLRDLQTEASQLKERYFQLIEEGERARLTRQQGAIAFRKDEEIDRNQIWEMRDREQVERIQEERRERERELIAQEEQGSWQINTDRWRARAQADMAWSSFNQARDYTLRVGEEARKAKTTSQLKEANSKRDEALLEEKKQEQEWARAEEEWKSLTQEYRKKRPEEMTEEQYEHQAQRDRAVNGIWERVLAKHQNSLQKRSAVEQDDIDQAIIGTRDRLHQEYQSSCAKYGDGSQAATADYQKKVFKIALEQASKYPEEMKEFWEDLAENQEQTPESTINREAAEVFKKEHLRLERIEKIWEGILKESEETKKIAREKAAQTYHQGDNRAWHDLPDQERTRYNDEVQQANEAYEQKRKEVKELITSWEKEAEHIGGEKERIKNKTLISATKRKEKLTNFEQRLEQLQQESNVLKEKLNKQDASLKLGERAWQKEKYYETLSEAHQAKKKAKEQRNDDFNKAASCYEQASAHWDTAADSSILDPHEYEQNAASYEKAAHYYTEAAKESGEGAAQQRGKKILIGLLQQAGEIQRQIAQQLEHKESTSSLEESLQQLEKQIDRLLGTRGAQIEELEEGIPLLQHRCEALAQEATTLRNQGKTALAVKKEQIAQSFRELLPSCQKSLENLFQEHPESSEQAASTIELLRSTTSKDQELQQRVEQLVQLEEKMGPLLQQSDDLQLALSVAQTHGEMFLAQGQERILTHLKQTLEKAKTLQQQYLTETINLLTPWNGWMSELKKLEAETQQLKKIDPQLRELDQKKRELQLRGDSLAGEIRTAQRQGETFLHQGLESLSSAIRNLLLEVDQSAGNLLTQGMSASATLAHQAAQKAEDIVKRCNQLQQRDQALQKNSSLLQQLNLKKTSLQSYVQEGDAQLKNSQRLQPIGEDLLRKAQEAFLREMTQALSTIEKSAQEILNQTPEQTTTLQLLSLHRLEERYQNFQKNLPEILQLDEQRTSLQKRLQDMPRETVSTYLSKAQQRVTHEMSALLSKLTQALQERFLGTLSSFNFEAKLLTSQLQQLREQDRTLQENAPYLRQLQEKKDLLEKERIALQGELQRARQGQQLFFVEEGESLLSDVQQTALNIDQMGQQLFSGSSTLDPHKEMESLLQQLEQLRERKQFLHQRIAQLSSLQEKAITLKTRAEALGKEIISSQLRGETLLAQGQKELKGEIEQVLQQTVEQVKQLLSATKMGGKDSRETLATMAQTAKELLLPLDALLVRDQNLKNNIEQLFLIEKKRTVLQESINKLTSQLDTNKPILAQTTLLQECEQAVKEASETISALWKGATQGLEKAAPFLRSFDELQHRNEELQTTLLHLENLKQKKTLLEQRSQALSKELSRAQNQGELLLVQGEEKLQEEMSQLLLRIDKVMEQLRLPTVGREETLQQVTTVLTEIEEYQKRDQRFFESIPQLRALIEKGQFLHTKIATLKEQKASPGQRERAFTPGHEQYLDKYQKAMEQVEELIQQLLAIKEGASNQSFRLLLEIQGLEKLEKQFNQLIEQVREKTLLLTEQVKQAKQASLEGRGGGYSHLWDRIVTKLEQARESWQHAQARVAQGESERATRWKQVAQNSEAAAEGVRNIIETYIAGKKEAAQKLGKENWSAYYLSDALTWDLKSEEALERANQIEQATPKGREENSFWKKRAEEYERAAKYERKAIEEFYHADEEKEEIAWGWAGRSSHATAEYQIKGTQAEQNGNLPLALEYRKLAEGCKHALDYFLKGALAHAAGKSNEGYSWHSAGQGFYWSAEKLEKATQADEEGKPEVAQKWREAAKLQQDSIDLYLEAAAVHKAEKTEEGQSWNNAGNGLYNAAEKLGKAIEAEAAGKPNIAQKWHEAAKLQQDSIDLFLKAAVAHKAGKTEEGTSWNDAGNGLYWSAHKLGKAIEADAEGKTAIAQKWRVAATLQKRSVDSYSTAAAAYEAGNIEKGTSWNNAGHGLTQAAEELGKAIEAEKKGNPEVAKQWRDAAKLSQDSIDFFLRAAGAESSGNREERKMIWNNAGHSLIQASEKLGKAIEADEEGKTAIAQKWRDAAKLHQDSINYYHKATLTFRVGKDAEGISLDSAGNGSHYLAESLGKAIEAEEKGKIAIAQKWREASKLFSDSMDAFLKGADARGIVNIPKRYIWNQVGNGLHYSAEKLGKAIEAEREGRLGEARQWHEASKLHQNSIDLYIKVTAAYTKGDNYPGNSLYYSEKNLEKAIEAEAAGKLVVAQKWRRAAKLHQDSIEHYLKAAAARAAGKTEEGQSWHNAGRGFYYAAEKLGKAIDAEAAGNQALAQKWREAAKLHQDSIDPFLKAAAAHKAGRTAEGYSWNNAGLGYYNAADSLGKAIEAELKRQLGKVRTLRAEAQQQLETATKAIAALRRNNG